MNYKEFGSGHSGCIMFLHGGAMSWWNYREEAELLQNEYHIIIPFLDGHAGSDKPFTSIESCAADLITWIRTHLNGSVFMICGLSLGGQILLEMLAQRGDICRYALVESAMVIPSRLTHALIRPTFGSSFFLIRQKWFAKLQFRQYRIKADYFGDYYRDTCAIRKEDMIAFLQANTSYQLKDAVRNCKADLHIYYGEKETRGIRKSAAVIRDAVPASTMTVLPGMYHGGFSFDHADAYVQAIRQIVQQP